jgi:hypothetical protein
VTHSNLHPIYDAGKRIALVFGKKSEKNEENEENRSPIEPPPPESGAGKAGEFGGCMKKYTVAQKKFLC